VTVVPQTRYAPSRGGYLAYQVLGDGPVDVMVIAELLSHCEHRWNEPTLARCLERLGEAGRVVMFDKRGAGLSDPVTPATLPTLEERAQDDASVLDTVGSSRCAVAGFSEGGVDAMFFAATRPERDCPNLDRAHRRTTSCRGSGASGLTGSDPLRG
jgi:pimeloyl-ACP methyl ester carboxylesterase